MARKARSTVAEAAALAREALFASAARTDGGKDDRLGDVILYDLTAGWRAPIEAVRTIFRANGLEPKHVLPNPPDWVVSFGRAVDQIRAKVRDQDVKLMDAAKGPNGERRVGIVQVSRNGVVATVDVGTVVCPGAGTEAERARARTAARRTSSATTGAASRRRCSTAPASTTRSTCSTTSAAPWSSTSTAGSGCRCAARSRTSPTGSPRPVATRIRRLRAAVEQCQAGQIELFTGYRSDPESQPHRRELGQQGPGGAARRVPGRRRQVHQQGRHQGGHDRGHDRGKQGAARAAGLYKAMLGAAVEDVDAKYAEFEAQLRKHLGIIETAADQAVAS